MHWQNLINFGILPLTFANTDDWNRIAPRDVLRVPDVREAIQRGKQVQILNQSKSETYMAVEDGARPWTGQRPQGKSHGVR